MGLRISPRWLQIGVYGVSLLFTTAIYAGWQQFSLILARGGAYKAKCPPGFHFDAHWEPCPAQDAALGLLLPIGGALEIAGELLGGFALDLWGLWQTASVGLFGNLVALLMFAVAPTIQHTSNIDILPHAMILTGLAINLIYFPALEIRHLFPNDQGLAVSFVIACQLLAEVVAPVIWSFWVYVRPQVSMVRLFLMYISFAYLPMALAYLGLLFRQRRRVTVSTRQITAGDREDEGVGSLELSTIPSEMTSRTGEYAALSPRPSPAVAARHAMNYLYTLAASPLGKAMLSSQYLLVIVLTSSFLIQAFHYQVILRPIAGPSVSELLGWLMPIDSVMSLILGRLADVVGPTNVMRITSLMMFLAFASLLMPSTVLHGLGLIPFIVGMSFAWTAKHVYINAAFPVEAYGRLVGVAGFCSGVSVLLSSRILQRTLTNISWSAILMGWSVVCFLIATYLGRHVPSRRVATPEKGTVVAV